MEMIVDNILLNLCKKIVQCNRTVKEWMQYESDDIFQSGKYEGGFDATEKEFCFSVYIEDIEYWFQLSLDEISKICDGSLAVINVRLPD